MARLKKGVGILVSVLLCLSFAACSSKGNVANTGATPKHMDKSSQITDHPKQDKTAMPESTMTLQKKTATLYVDFSNGSENPTPDQKVNYPMEYTGDLTPQMLCDALSKLTGLNFTAEVTRDKKGIWVKWSKKSTLMKGVDGHTPNKEFIFADESSMRWFMLDSLWQTLIENFGMDVYYTTGNGDSLVVKSLEPGITFDKDTSYKGSTYYYTAEKQSERINPKNTDHPK